MATSSITKNFVISGKRQVEKFISAIEESAKDLPVRTSITADIIESDAELIEIMRRWEEMNAK